MSWWSGNGLILSGNGLWSMLVRKLSKMVRKWSKMVRKCWPQAKRPTSKKETPDHPPDFYSFMFSLFKSFHVAIKLFQYFSMVLFVVNWFAVKVRRLVQCSWEDSKRHIQPATSWRFTKKAPISWYVRTTPVSNLRLASGVCKHDWPNFFSPEGGLSISQAAQKLANAEEAFNDLVDF